jgi:hypothetical protein
MLDLVATFEISRRSRRSALAIADAAADRFIQYTLGGVYVGRWLEIFQDTATGRWTAAVAVMYEPLMTDGTTHVEARVPQHCPDGAPL